MDSNGVADLNDSSSSYSWDYSDFLHPEHARILNITTITFYALIITVGLLGNILVIFSILRTCRHMLFTSMLLCSLAVADLLFTVVVIPINLYVLYDIQWIFGEVGCQLFGIIWILCPASSAIMLLVISVERYLVVLHPLQARVIFTRKKGCIIVIVTWVLSFLLSLVSVPFMKYNVLEHEGAVYRWCVRSVTTLAEKIIYSSYFLIVLYIMPLICMSFSNIKTVRALHRSIHIAETLRNAKPIKMNGITSSRDNMSEISNSQFSYGETEISVISYSETTGYKAENPAGESNGTKHGGASGRQRGIQLQERKRVMRLLILLVFIYTILWGPILLYIPISYFVDIGGNTKIQVSLAVNLLATSNSAVNPVVYALMSRSFQQVVRKAILFCRSRDKTT